MSIVNGTFNTDLSGWTLAVVAGSNSDIIWDNGRARLRVYQCNNVSLSQHILIDGPTLSFDWETKVDMWEEYCHWSLLLDDGTLVINEEGFQTSNSAAGGDYKGTRTLDISKYVGKNGTITFSIAQSDPCANGDHANTYLWIDNVSLPTSTTPILTTITVSPSNPTIATSNTQQFAATCLSSSQLKLVTTIDQNGNTITCPTLTWDTTDHTLGTITSDGLFTAHASSGSVTVTATVGTIVGSATAILSPAVQTPVVQAGFGTLQTFMIVGLVIGTIYMMRKKKQT